MYCKKIVIASVTKQSSPVIQEPAEGWIAASRALLAMTVLMLTGCSAGQDMQGNDPVDYYAQHPIKNKIEMRQQSYVTYFCPQKTKLAADEMDRLNHKMHGISMPAVESVRVELTKQDICNEDRKAYIKRMMRRMGYDKGDIIFATAPQELAADHVLITVNYAVVVPPECPDWRTSPVTTYSNTTQGNFYCSQEVNTGLMVADPHDLVSGTGDVATSTQRAALAVQNYNSSTPPPSSTAASPSTSTAPTAVSPGATAQ